MAKSVLSKIAKPLKAEVAALQRQRDEIDTRLSSLESVWNSLFGKTKRGPKARKGKRGKKRNATELAKLAKDVHDFIVASKDKGGVMAGAITKKFGKLMPSPKAFLKKYGITVTTKGPKKRPTYHA